MTQTSGFVRVLNRWITSAPIAISLFALISISLRPRSGDAGRAVVEIQAVRGARFQLSRCCAPPLLLGRAQCH